MMKFAPAVIAQRRSPKSATITITLRAGEGRAGGERRTALSISNGMAEPQAGHQIPIASLFAATKAIEIVSYAAANAAIASPA
jgi:hypothetical protein